MLAVLTPPALWLRYDHVIIPNNWLAKRCSPNPSWIPQVPLYVLPTSVNLRTDIWFVQSGGSFVLVELFSFGQNPCLGGVSAWESRESITLLECGSLQRNTAVKEL